MSSKAHSNPKSMKWLISLAVMIAVSAGVVIGAVSLDKAVNGKYLKHHEVPEIISTQEVDIALYGQAAAMNSIKGLEKGLDKDGNVVAYLVSGTTTGYNTSAPIEMTTIVSADGTLICGIEINKQKETEYLGANISTDAFKAQFEGRLMPVVSSKSNEKGSTIDALTGATISTEAVIGGVDKAVAFLEKAKFIEVAE